MCSSDLFPSHDKVRKKLGGEDENKDVVTVGTKGATALLCADAMYFTTNKRPYQW